MRGVRSEHRIEIPSQAGLYYALKDANKTRRTRQSHGIIAFDGLRWRKVRAGGGYAFLSLWDLAPFLWPCGTSNGDGKPTCDGQSKVQTLHQKLRSLKRRRESESETTCSIVSVNNSGWPLQT